jgi:hypothetical protein
MSHAGFGKLLRYEAVLQFEATSLEIPLKNRIPSFIAALVLIVAALPVSAGVLFTTGLSTGNNPAFTATGSGRDIELEQSSIGQYLVIADPFTVTANATATDLLVPLSLAGSSSPFNNGAVVDFSIVSSVSGAPDADFEGNPISPLYTGAASGITGTTGAIYDVSLTGTATLAAGTTYWIIAKEPGTSPVPGCSFNSTCTATYDYWYNNTSSTNSPADLTDFEDGFGAPNPQTNLAVTVEGNAVSSATPEPSSLILLASALFCALLGSSRLRRKSAPATVKVG